ncbi:hypothetical protein GIY23_12815 [Allosaccharopolyspora coralli]|uniref:Uncharacterized protein n=1 Tax=Allosaccharopolyspora coralli TaxID=2665642 RepID=A0A5Q3QHH5_9PSEU|nr:hypothetical protein [Allosaccharopolyspora coralli]QGK70287.1 hypothetical protein GIY23_12815 [Allosaccharopolyspora coralli]
MRGRSDQRPGLNTTDLINSSGAEIAFLRDRLADAESFMDTLGAFVGTELHLDPPRRTHCSLDDVQKVLLCEAADIPHDTDPAEIRSLVRGLYHRRSLVRAGVTVVASVESIIIPRRLPVAKVDGPSATDLLFSTNLPLGKVLEPYGARRQTHDVGVRWWASDDTPPSWDTDILRITGQLDLELPVAWLTETVDASALHLHRANRIGASR